MNIVYIISFHKKETNILSLTDSHVMEKMASDNTKIFPIFVFPKQGLRKDGQRSRHIF